MIQYKVVEISVVTDEEIERVVNEWTSMGWVFESLQFAMREASKRPAMAFVFFTRKMANTNENNSNNEG
jgi:hypothetical protein